MFKGFGAIVAAVACLCTPHANAALFLYTGQTLSSGGYVKASADVTFTGAGTYVLGAGLNSFTISGYDAGNVLRASVSMPGVGSDGWVNYMIIDASMQVTQWFLLGNDSVGASQDYAYTLGNDSGAPSNCFCGTQDFYTGNNVQSYETNFSSDGATAGRWQANAAPAPTSLALLGLGLAGLAVARRRPLLAA